MTRERPVVGHMVVRRAIHGTWLLLAGWLVGGCTGVVAESSGSPVSFAGSSPIAGSTGAAGIVTSGGAPSGPTAGGPAAPPSDTGGVAAGGAPGAATGGTGEAPATCGSIASEGAAVPMRRLTATQVERSVAEILGVKQTLGVTDERLFTFKSNVSSSVDGVSARGYFDFASAVVAEADLSRCETDCRDWLFDEIGRRLFRRPLDDAQREKYAALYELGADNGGPSQGAAWALEAMLQSPSFLYLDEGVKADTTLDDYALASRLSLLLWGSNPDEALLERAARGELSTPEQVTATATELLGDPRAENGLREFVDQWLDLARLDDADQRPDLAELGSETIAALREEPVLFFRSLVDEGGGLGELLSSSEAPSSPLVEPLYGADILERTGDGVRLDPARRAGILSMPGVVAALSHARRTSPTLRGKAVLTSLLCLPPSPPPAGVSVDLPEVSADVSARERFELHVSDPGCAGCHRTMDGIGFALEKLDWLGRYREDENGHAIDDQSSFALSNGEVTVRGAAELSHALAAEPLVAACVSKQWLRYALGVPESTTAACLIERLSTEIREPGGLERMILTALTSDWFRRRPEALP